MARPPNGSAVPLRERTAVDEPPDLGPLFHRLNNQLGIILANAELIETKAQDEALRSRAAQIVASVLDAMSTATDLRAHLKTDRS